MGILEKFTNITKWFATNVSQYGLIWILLIMSVYFSIKTKFVQIRLFPDSIKLIFQKKKRKGMSSFQALMISTAARVGTGCIAGVATALKIGGAGAVFWMWFVAILSSSLTFVECTLAQMYKVKNPDGSFRGGPAYYIEKVLHKRWFGVLYSSLLVITYAYGFNSFQSHMISDALAEYIPEYNSGHLPLIVGVIIAVITLLIIFGGMDRIGFISSYIVPVMSLGYLGLGIAIVFINIGRVHMVIGEIFSSAFTNVFNFGSVGGGIIGAVLMEGIKKGLLTHESGMGSAANVAATADVSHPAKQGISQLFSVFITTFIVCTTTAFIVLLSDLDLSGELKDIALVQYALKSQVGRVGDYFLTFAVFLFSFSTIVGNYSYAESNVLFICNSKKILYVFRVSCTIILVLGAIAPSQIVWNVIDILMTFMVVANVIAMFLIRKRALICLKDYVYQKKSGKDPVFKSADVGLSDMEVWN